MLYDCILRFGEGYTLSLRVKGPDFEDDVTSVKQFIDQHFPNAVLKVVMHIHVHVYFQLSSKHLNLVSLSFLRALSLRSATTT